MHIEKRGKSLIIRWKVDCKAYHISLKDHNNDICYPLAVSLLDRIQTDIRSNNFDPTLVKYDTRKAKKAAKLQSLTARELFDRYAEYRDELSHNSKKGRFKSISSRLNQFLGKTPASKVTADIAVNVIKAWSEQACERTLRDYLYLLVAAWDWAKKEDLYGLGDSNPWNQPLNRLRKKKLPPRKKPIPFTIEELRTISQGFKNHPKHSHYADAAIFISQTACRFGEIAALRWCNVGIEFDTVLFCPTVSRGKCRDTTKTDEDRIVVLTETLKEMLRSRYEATKPQPDDLVFPAPKGGYMDDNRFRGKIWIPVLQSCGIDYQKPYNLRHTGTSQAYANGASLPEIAAQTGHSVKTLMSTYLHPTQKKCVFVDFEVERGEPSSNIF
jgi:integrase